MVNQNIQQGFDGLFKHWAVRGVAAVAVTTSLLASCATPEPQANSNDSTNVSAEEIAENTSKYIGQTVTVRSEPIEKIGTSTFTVEDEQFFGSEPILVVNASGKPFVFPEEDGVDIQATGEVRNFVLADLNREYSLDLDANVYRDYENRPAIIAESIAIAPEPGELTSDPEKYYGRPVAVTGEVEEIQGANAFTLDDDALFGSDDLLVLRATPTATNQAAFEDGEKVAVTGVLRPFVVADLERDYDFTWDQGIRQELEAEYSNKPVFVAEEIYPSAIPEAAQ